MKTIRVHQFGGPDVLQLEHLPDPWPGPGEVLIRARAIGVNPVETYLRSGSNPRLPLPYTPGTDAAGEVVAVGENARAYHPGDRVYTSGTVTGSYAELIVSKTADVHPLPPKTPFSCGAAVGIPYATAYRALFQKAGTQGGETVLIHGGSGGVGTAAIELAVAADLTVIATVGTPKGGDLARQKGAHHVLNHHEDGYLARISEITGGRGVEVILEMLASVNLSKDLSLLAVRGRVIIIGSRGPVEINPRDAMMRDADIRAMLIFNATPAEKAAIHASLHAGLENGTLNPIIGREFPLAEAAQAHQAVLQPGAYGKMVLLP